MSERNHDFDVIVVGGRVAGAALAARLGKYGFTVLMLERGQHPSLPAVSAPIIYAPTMKLLDEIGADESAYAHNTPKIKHMVTMSSGFQGSLRLPDHSGRDYAYAVDRARFDAALWDAALRFPGVSGRQNYHVTDLIFEDDHVVGIRGKGADGQTEAIYARVVVGADGRFGVVARKTQAQERDRWDDYPTSIYYAYWQNVTPMETYSPCAVAYEGDGPYGYLTMDSADGQTMVGVEGRSDSLEPESGQIEAFYLAMLQGQPQLWERFANAEMVTSVRGMRHIGNTYRQPGGPGWALVGDAYHQKDPLDGQGIYNAVVTTKALAQSIRKWHQGELNWEAALADYDEVSRIKTYGMYKSLQSRIRGSFYSNGGVQVPEWVLAKVGAWVLADPQMSDLMGKMLTRQIPADLVTMMTPPVMLGAIARGGLKDLRQRVSNRFREGLGFGS